MHIMRDTTVEMKIPIYIGKYHVPIFKDRHKANKHVIWITSFTTTSA